MRYLWPLVGLASTVFAAAVVSCGGSGDTASSSSENGFGGQSSNTSTTNSHNGSEGNGSNSGGSTSSGFHLPDAGGDAACPTLTTCAEQHKDCDAISDGCGGILQCGDCPTGKTCSANVCGVPPCTPTTCTALGFNCGPAGDGCGHPLDCGTCTLPESCGGSGVSSVCGAGMMCMPKSCADLGFDCGPAGDGCGGQLDCGTCTAPNTCGGGGPPSTCGVPPCTPNTCNSLGINCGPAGDGCGGILQCGTCDLPTTCGGLGMPSVCGKPSTCTGLCTQQVTCPNGGTTSISGVVYAPNGVDPLPNVLVFVPNGMLQPFTPGVSCDNCAAGVTGDPLVSAVTDTEGKFSITNAPVGSGISLVMQTGRWRRQIPLPDTAQCVDNPVANGTARLPKNQGEGDIPHMAFATGSVDVLECVIRKIGVDDGEFRNPGGGGRIDIYQGDSTVNIAGEGTFHIGGARVSTMTPSETTLVNSLTTLENYDMVLFPCKGAEEGEPGATGGGRATPGRTAAQLQNLVDYTSAGGRVFATHFSYVWFDKKQPFAGTAAWDINQCDPFTSPDGCFQTTGYPPDQNGIIDQTFPKGLALAEWLQYIGASTTQGSIPINTLRWDLDNTIPPSQTWMQINDPEIGSVPMHYTFNTPVGAAADSQCGRVLFDDFHVENKGFIDCPPGAGCTAAQTDSYNTIFPGECASGPMTAQEKLLEFMIFDLGSCVTPDIPVCTKTTCGAQNVSCGPAGDGCGGLLDCGPCPTGQTCGGGGVPSQCGAPSCDPLTCLDQGIHCGPAGDGCGMSLDCGTCPTGQTCGGGGMPGVCGSGTCTPTTCAAQHIMCGPAGDGCGGPLSCGNCPAGQTCGGGGMPGVCGNTCTPLTCTQQGYNCGQAGDGCGKVLNCGMCSAPETCGGGGKPNICGGSQPG